MDFLSKVLNWFKFAGESSAPRMFDARRSQLYLALQCEELAEKLTVIYGASHSTVQMLNFQSERLKNARNAYEFSALDTTARAALLDADVDLLWVSLGAANAQGADVAGACNAVAEANLAKFPGGVVSRDPTGKVLKPEGWHPPDLTPFVLSGAQ